MGAVCYIQYSLLYGANVILYRKACCPAAKCQRNVQTSRETETVCSCIPPSTQFLNPELHLVNENQTHPSVVLGFWTLHVRNESLVRPNQYQTTSRLLFTTTPAVCELYTLISSVLWTLQSMTMSRVNVTADTNSEHPNSSVFQAPIQPKSHIECYTY